MSNATLTPAKMTVSRSYDHYYVHREIQEILLDYAKRFPNYARATSLAKTPEGRDIWLFELTDLSTGDFSQKPAYCAAGTLHASEVTGTMCVMFFLDYLLTNRESDPKVKELLQTYTICAIPTISPDGLDYFVTTPNALRSVPRMYPFDELQRGIQCKDMDGDGVIRQMRFKDPNGPWKISDIDPRMMELRSPDDVTGDFYSVFREGVVEGDPKKTRITGADPFGHDLNRSFPLGWRPESQQKGAGKYPLSNVENRSLADFINDYKNLCAFLVYHTSAGVFFYPPSFKHPKDAPREDIARYKAVLKMGWEETGYPAANIYETFCEKQDMFSAGSLDDYIHFACGIFTCACECWDLEIQAGIPGKWQRLPNKETADEHFEYELKTLRWVDKTFGKEAFKPWTKFDHPQLGEVEIGGFDYKWLIINCPIDYLGQEMEKTGRFMQRQINTLPKIEFSEASAQKLEEGVYRIKAGVINRRYLPTYVTREAVNLKIAKGVTVEIGGDGLEVASGKQKADIGHLAGFSGVRAEHHFTNYLVIPGGEPFEKEVDWVVKAKKGTEITLTAVSEKAGVATARLTLK